MPMYLNLKYNGKQIVDYKAQAWWITGFNPYYQNKKSGSLTAKFSIYFPSTSKKSMYQSFYNKYKKKSKWEFTKKSGTASYKF